MTRPPSPLEFFKHLKWLDNRPLLDVIEPYRQRIFEQALFTFDDEGWPMYNMVLAGRGKKNWKSADLCLAALYRFLAWRSPSGDQSTFVLANDLDQANDDLKLVKKLVEHNPVLEAEVTVRAREVERNDGRGALAILPAKDVAGSHGKTFNFVGYDEIHAYRNWDLFEAMSPDPSRRDALVWITSYDVISSSSKVPLTTLKEQGKAGEDPRFFFSWYSASYTTDPDFEDKPTGEEKANPSLPSWNNPHYLPQQKRRLPAYKYRRLHLNEPGAADGVFFDADKLLACVVEGRKRMNREDGKRYVAFVDMSGGSNDDACLSVAHAEDDGRAVLDLVEGQAGRAPFNPRKAVEKFVGILKEYGLSKVTGDNYAGETFKRDFEDLGVKYEPCKKNKSDLYAAIEPKVNAGEVELLDVEPLTAQALTLVWKGTKIDHQAGDHDDWINAAAGALHLAAQPTRQFKAVPPGSVLKEWSEIEAQRNFNNLGTGI